MIYCLGIDRGDSGCRAAVADATGRLVGRGQAGPANVNTDPDGARANVMAAIGTGSVFVRRREGQMRQFGRIRGIGLRIIHAEDPAAASVLDAGMADVWAILSKLQEGGAPLPVVFTGGLGAVYAARLSRYWPLREARGTGLDGALAMARDMALSTEGAG